MTDFLMIGEVLKPQGIRGECKIRPSAADIYCFKDWDTLYLRNNSAFVPISFRLNRIHEGFVYAVLGNSKTPEDAEHFRGTQLFIDRAHAAPLEKGAYYIADLIGCEAIDRNGQTLGKLKEILQNGPVDTWVFAGNRPFMAPALLRVFTEVDLSKGKIFVDDAALEEVAVFED